MPDSARSLDTLLAVRLDSKDVRRARRFAAGMDMSLSEFIRRATLVALSNPDILCREDMPME
jgi:hypothetical protein